MGENPSCQQNSCKEIEKNGGNKKVCGRGHWKPSEDSKLRQLVDVFGPQNWNFIAGMLDESGSRSGKSCRLRWYNQLDPRINRRSMTEEEEERLMEAHSVYGNKWAFISRHFFPGRTDNAIKNHWHVLMARKHNRPIRKRSASNVSANCDQISPHGSCECNNNNKVNDNANTTPHYDDDDDELQNVEDDTILGSTADDRCPLLLESADFLKITDQTPVFIDFLGVGP